jgi:hypothetical protein
VRTERDVPRLNRIRPDSSALVDGPGLQVALQVSGSITAVVFGSVASVLAWRWWGGRADR